MVLDIALLAFLAFFILLLATAVVHMIFLVPYVPSSRRTVLKMIRAARLKPNDQIYDLGCGDGRLLFAAEKRTRTAAVGFEIAPLVYLLAVVRKWLGRCASLIRFQSFFSANLRTADVIFCYLIPNVMPRLAEKIRRECRKGTRIISNTFHIPGLALHRVIKKDPRYGTPTVYVYTV